MRHSSIRLLVSVPLNRGLVRGGGAVEVVPLLLLEALCPVVLDDVVLEVAFISLLSSFLGADSHIVVYSG